MFPRNRISSESIYALTANEQLVFQQKIGATDDMLVRLSSVDMPNSETDKKAHVPGRSARFLYDGGSLPPPPPPP